MTAVHLAGLALDRRDGAAAARRGLPDLRTAHGFLVQHVVTGPRPIGEIAERMGVSQQAVSKSVGELVGSATSNACPTLTTGGSG